MTDLTGHATCYGPGDTVPPIECGTARKLWDALDITRESWTEREEIRCPWLFRGMRRAQDQLLPPAWRREGDEHDIIAKAKAEVERDDAEELGRVLPRERAWSLQRRAECRLVHRFIEHASACGLTLPPDMPTRWSKTNPRPEHEVVALAQHHGVPTQLLDFTTDPHVAMFWACEEPWADDDHLALWALRRPAAGAVGWEIHAHSRARNRNLFAQDGVAVVMTQANDLVNEGKELPALETCGRVRKGTLQKYTLPRSEVPALRRLLMLSGITHAKLMPGYDGVAATVLASYR